MSKNCFIEYEFKGLDQQELLDFAINSKSKFNRGKVIHYPGGVGKEEVDDEYRVCLSFHDSHVVRYAGIIENFIKQNIKDVCENLGVKEFEWGKRESYCTAYGNGAFFFKHRDTLKDGRPQRILTWVYYFNKSPKAFKGGEICFFPKKGDSLRVDVNSGKLVVFPSNLVHQVEQVSLSDEAFENCRFALTGFIRQRSSFASRVLYLAKLFAKRLLGHRLYNHLKIIIRKYVLMIAI